MQNLAKGKDRKIMMFLYGAILTARKNQQKKVSLAALRKQYPKQEYMIFSWMQWPDAKRWFNACNDADGICYILRPEYHDTPSAEIYETLKQIYL